MLETLFEPLQASAISQALRASIWVYPIVNMGHLLGMALLIGAIVPLDLRLIGFWPGLPVAPLARILVPVSASGLVLTVLCGTAMFAARPLDYAGATIFQAKLLLVLLAVSNALWLHRTRAWQRVLADGTRSRRVLIAATASLILWTGALVLGRLLGFR